MQIFALPFMRYAILASTLAGMALSLIGIFVIARRISFVGLSVSQLAALGTVCSVMLSLHYSEFAFALIWVGIGFYLLSLFSKKNWIPPETWVACLYILGAGMSILMLSKAPNGETHTLNVFFGNVLALGFVEVVEALAILGITLLLLWIGFYHWVWITFDSESAQISGVTVRFWDFIFYSLFAIVMTVAIHIFGVLLAFAYLLAPATIGLILFRNLKKLFIFVPILTLCVTLLGFYGSFQLDFPTGPFIATTLVLVTFLSTLFSKN